VTLRLKHVAVRNDGGAWGDDPDGVRDTIVLRSTEQTVDGSWRISDPAIRAIDEAEARNLRLAVGDILVTKSSGSDLHIGKASLVNCTIEKMNPVFSNFNQRIRVNNWTEPRFIWYFMNSGLARFHYVQRANSTSGLGNLTRTILGELPIPEIEVSNQKAIADFLDRETARIDQLIEKKEWLADRLKQKQRALLDLMITGGMSENQSRKPVSVSWLSDIPCHWSALPIKKILAMPITDGPHETPEFVDEGVIFISAEAIQGGEIDFNRKRGYITPTANSVYSRKYSPRSGDIYIVKSGATTGKSAMVREFTDFNIWSPLAVLRPSSSINGEYLLMAVRSKSFRDAIALNWSWGTQQNIGMGVLGRIVVPVPPKVEQDWIVQQYEEETAAIRHTITLVGKSIDRLRELRSALITAAVTGQVDPATWGRRGETDQRLKAIERDLELQPEREVAPA
jgi:type I restriction enzyme, S subunit